jgi:hypothetical protein
MVRSELGKHAAQVSIVVFILADNKVKFHARENFT